MNDLKLLYSYEEWKKNKTSLLGGVNIISKDFVRLMELGISLYRTGAEELEYKYLRKKIKLNSANKEYTKLTYEITDMYNKLKDIHDDDMRHEIYEDIGRKQCEIEILREEKE